VPDDYPSKSPVRWGNRVDRLADGKLALRQPPALLVPRALIVPPSRPENRLCCTDTMYPNKMATACRGSSLTGFGRLDYDSDSNSPRFSRTVLYVSCRPGAICLPIRHYLSMADSNGVVNNSVINRSSRGGGVGAVGR